MPPRAQNIPGCQRSATQHAHMFCAFIYFMPPCLRATPAYAVLLARLRRYGADAAMRILPPRRRYDMIFDYYDYGYERRTVYARRVIYTYAIAAAMSRHIRAAAACHVYYAAPPAPLSPMLFSSSAIAFLYMLQRMRFAADAAMI